MPRTLSRRAFFTGRRPEPVQSPARPARGEAAARRVAQVAANCLAVSGVTCSVCADPCEPRALRVKPLVGGRALPIVDTNACTGCGDCAKVCPVGALVLAEADPEEAACA